MESIKINAIDKKDSGLVIVNYNDNKEATLNTKWQSQEVDYLEKDVGLGGQCIVEIKVKGEYTNITKVDMTSAVKGEMDTKCTLSDGALSAINSKPEPSRDHSIVCQCLLKIAGSDLPFAKEQGEYGRCVCEKLQELVAAYKLGVSLLDE